MSNSVSQSNIKLLTIPTLTKPKRMSSTALRAKMHLWSRSHRYLGDGKSVFCLYQDFVSVRYMHTANLVSPRDGRHPLRPLLQGSTGHNRMGATRRMENGNASR